VLHFPLSDLRRQRWSEALAWHREARRIAAALGIGLATLE
jgi:hypothetical protein